jgi:hypothetical protein
MQEPPVHRVGRIGDVLVQLPYHFFWEWHSTTQTLTTRTHTHPYEYTYANPTPMRTSEGLITGRSGDSRSHQWRLVVDGNVAYHLMHNASKSWKIQEKVRAPGFEPWWVASHWTVLPLDYKSNRNSHIILSLSSFSCTLPSLASNAPHCSASAYDNDILKSTLHSPSL